MVGSFLSGHFSTSFEQSDAGEDIIAARVEVKGGEFGYPVT